LGVIWLSSGMHITRSITPPTVAVAAASAYAPPHLRDVCAILAAGILRLRSSTGEETARRAEPAWGSGDIRLHSTARQRLHVLPNREG